jgi:aspartate aminotransferase-like enzyme
VSLSVKSRLYAPGPVEVPPRVLAAMAEPPLHHRSQAFRARLGRVREKLAEIACVPGDEVVVLTGSGTAAFEAGLLAAVPRGSVVLGLAAGKFGERWLELARHYGYQVLELRAPWGEAIDPEAVREKLREHPEVTAVTTTHSETSTGVLHDVRAIAEAVRETAPEALVLVDAVTSLAVAELKPREWGLDGIFAGSQKGLMTPPGLGFAWLSKRAWSREGERVPSYYLALHKERARQRKGETAYTPAVSLIAGLEAALDLLLEEGLERVWQRRSGLNEALLAAGEALGCRRYAARPSPAAAAMRAPDGLLAPAIVRGFAARGARIAGGQDHAKEVLFRPSLMGYADAYDAVTLAAILEDVLRELGREVPYGLGVAKVLEHLSRSADPLVSEKPF